MFDIISKDVLRKQIECASDNHVTVIYDDKGFPNLMCVIPRMTIGDCFPAGVGDGQLDSYLTETHPAFKIYDSTTRIYEKDVPEIFVGQYRSNFVYDDVDDYSTYTAISLPGFSAGAIPYELSGTYPIRTTIENKGTNWHLMNAWEYGAIQFWCYNNDIHVYGQDKKGIDINGRKGVKEKIVIYSHTTSGWNVGDKITGQTTGASGVIVDSYYRGLSTVYRYLEIEDIYGYDFEDGETVISDSDTAGVIYIETVENRGGSGDRKWYHDHTFHGICDLGSLGEEVFDGLRVRRVDVGGNDYYMFYITDGNYYQWNDSLLFSLPAKLALSAEGVMQLGYQGLSGGLPDGVITDLNLVSGTKFVNILEQTQNYIDFVGDKHRKYLTLLGIDRIEIETSEKVNELRREYTSIEQASGNNDDTIFVKGKPVAVSGKGVYSDMWRNGFNGFGGPISTWFPKKYKSRVVYIPS